MTRQPQGSPASDRPRNAEGLSDVGYCVPDVTQMWLIRAETGEGRHAEFCALKKLNDNVDNVDLSGCTVYTTLEPCSKRKPPKLPCATRLIKAKAARVVSGMPNKDKDVYGFSSLAEAGIHIGLFPNDLMQELLALNKAWSDTRREPDIMPPPNETNAIANVSYYKPGTSMQENIHLVVRPPKDVGGFYTIEDATKQGCQHEEGDDAMAQIVHFHPQI